jgi:deoxyxylulose-5-phosphate synthase
MHQVVAVVGDGALTAACVRGAHRAGMSMTAMVVVLNDNAMSISKMLARCRPFDELRQWSLYRQLKHASAWGWTRCQLRQAAAARHERGAGSLKSLVIVDKFFGALGF